MGKSVICVIPARLGSHRMEQKMLAPLKGKPLVVQTMEAALRVPLFDKVVVAVDCQELYEVVTLHGGEAVYTSSECKSGTERLIELHQKKKYHADTWVNWQGDEPFITTKMIKTLLQSCEEVSTLKKKIMNLEEAASPDVVKVVSDKGGRALYFSRAQIPYFRDERETDLYKHIGIYAYSSQALGKMAGFSPCSFEEVEKLEQLRFLYEGLSIQVHETKEETLGIDTEEELQLAQRLDLSHAT